MDDFLMANRVFSLLRGVIFGEGLRFFVVELEAKLEEEYVPIITVTWSSESQSQRVVFDEKPSLLLVSDLTDWSVSIWFLDQSSKQFEY